jgi:transposase
LTARVARAAFPKGNPYLRLRDELGPVFPDAGFADLYPRRGQPALPPWKLALVTVMQFAGDLSDRQAADAVHGRIDWKYALGLELDDPGFNFSVLSEFRGRLTAGGAERLLLDQMLEVCKARGLFKARARQHTDSTHVLAATRDLNRLELVGETLRAALNTLAAVAPGWLRRQAPSRPMCRALGSASGRAPTASGGHRSSSTPSAQKSAVKEWWPASNVAALTWVSAPVRAVFASSNVPRPLWSRACPEC